MHGKCDNEYFLKIMRNYINKNYKDLNSFQVEITLDLFKYFINFKDEELKDKLAERQAFLLL